MKQIIIIITAILLFIPLASASIILEPITDNSIISTEQITSIKTYCLNNGDYCNNSISCNISITDNQNSFLVTNQPMSYNTNLFNYTYTFGGYGQHQIIYGCNYLDNTTIHISEIYVLPPNITNTPQDQVNIIWLGVIILFGLFLFVIYNFNKNMVIGWAGSTILLLPALYIWIFGAYNKIILLEKYVFYEHLTPSLITHSVATILVLISLWWFVYASTQKVKNTEIEKDYDVEMREEL